MEDKSITVIGLGHVGLPLVLLGIRKGFKVTGLDNDSVRLSNIQNKISPFKDPEVNKGLKEFGPHVTNEYSVIKKTNVIVVCVPTTMDNSSEPNLAPLIAACSELAHCLRKGQLVIIESSVNPGTCEETLIPILEKRSALRCGKDFSLAYCPSRISPSDTKWHVGNIPRVIGGYDGASLKRAYNFYSHLIDAPLRKMESLQETEAVSLLEDSFRDVNIALANEFAMSLADTGVNILNVIDGAATKPFSFTAYYPGAGVGGHHLSPDLKKQSGFGLTKLAVKINSNMPEYIVDLVRRGFDQEGLILGHSRIAVLGLAYKAETSDICGSPALKIIKLLQQSGASVTAYDPYISDKPKLIKCDFATNLKEALLDTEAIIVVTDHREFKNMDPNMLFRKRLRIIVDGRNCLDKEQYEKLGFRYIGVGH